MVKAVDGDVGSSGASLNPDKQTLERAEDPGVLWFPLSNCCTKMYNTINILKYVVDWAQSTN